MEIEPVAFWTLDLQCVRKETGELAFAEANLQGVLFRFSAGPGMHELRNTAWWSIISTFRFTKD